MNDEQRSLAFFQEQPEGPGLFYCPAALLLAYVAQLQRALGVHRARSALLDNKTGPVV